ncbi:hypothetical protein CsSME_00008958 [Camellia sinensis var. sinensis]
MREREIEWVHDDDVGSMEREREGCPRSLCF